VSFALVVKFTLAPAGVSMLLGKAAILNDPTLEGFLSIITPDCPTFSLAIVITNELDSFVKLTTKLSFAVKFIVDTPLLGVTVVIVLLKF